MMNSPFGTDLNPMGRVRIIGGRQVEMDGAAAAADAGPADTSAPPPHLHVADRGRRSPPQANERESARHHTEPRAAPPTMNHGADRERPARPRSQMEHAVHSDHRVRAIEAPRRADSPPHQPSQQYDQWGRPVEVPRMRSHPDSSRELGARGKEPREFDQHRHAPPPPPVMADVPTRRHDHRYPPLDARGVVPPISNSGGHAAAPRGIDREDPPRQWRGDRERAPDPQSRRAEPQPPPAPAARTAPPQQPYHGTRPSTSQNEAAVGAKYSALPPIQQHRPAQGVSTPPFADTSYSEKVFRRQLRAASVELVEHLLVQIAGLPVDSRNCVERGAVFNLLRKSPIRFSSPDVVHVLKVIDTHDNGTIPLERFHTLVAEAAPDARHPDPALNRQKSEKVAPVVDQWRGRDPAQAPAHGAPEPYQQPQVDGASHRSVPERAPLQPAQTLPPQWQQVQDRYTRGWSQPDTVADAEDDAGWEDTDSSVLHEDALSARIHQLNASRLSLDNHIKMYSFTSPRPPVAMAAPQDGRHYS